MSITTTTKVVSFISACALVLVFFFLAGINPSGKDLRDKSISIVNEVVDKATSSQSKNKSMAYSSDALNGKDIFEVKGEDGLTEFTDKVPSQPGSEFTTKMLNQDQQNVVSNSKTTVTQTKQVPIIQNSVTINNQVNISSVVNGSSQGLCEFYRDRLDGLRLRMIAGYTNSQSDWLHQQERNYKEKIRENC